jgi:hypothetical protein
MTPTITDRITTLVHNPALATHAELLGLLCASKIRDIEVARMERTLDEIVADAMEGAPLPTYSCIPRRERHTAQVIGFPQRGSARVGSVL